jgi:hypothetical protein
VLDRRAQLLNLCEGSFAVDTKQSMRINPGSSDDVKRAFDAVNFSVQCFWRLAIVL